MQDIVIKKSKIQGKGVFAGRDFKKGDIVIEWNPKKILTREQVAALPEAEKHYVSNYEDDEFVLQNSPERYVNHSCDPNTEVRGKCDSALRNIKRGEEITSDYSKDKSIVPFKCTCGSKRCRKKLELGV